MLTPTQGATSYYKIGEKVTFAWNYTSLAVTPSAVNVVASCSMNDATYTISNNMSVAETGKVTWDTGKYQANATVPLLTATYTLVVYDVDGEIGDTASAGRLGSQNQFSFGMYVPQAYTPLNGRLSPPSPFFARWIVILTRQNTNAQHATVPFLNSMAMLCDSPWAWLLLRYSVLRGLLVDMVFLLFDAFSDLL